MYVFWRIMFDEISEMHKLLSELKIFTGENSFALGFNSINF